MKLHQQINTATYSDMNTITVSRLAEHCNLQTMNYCITNSRNT